MSGLAGLSGFIGAGVGIGFSLSQENSIPTLGGTFATLGGVTFTVVGSPQKQKIRDRSYYAKVEVYNTYPTLQWLYDDLTEINVDILLHYMWCTPASVVSTFQQMRVSHQPQTFTIGPTNMGNFLIRQIEEDDTWRADDGTLLVALMRLELIQYAGQVNQSNPNYLGTNQAPPGSVVTYAPMPLQAPPTTGYQDVSLQNAVRMGGNAIVLAGNL